MTMYGVPKPAYRGLELIAGTTGNGQSAVVVSGGASARQYTNAAGAVVGATDGTVDVCVTTSGSPTNMQVTALVSNYNISSGLPPAPQNVTLIFVGVAGAVWPPTATLVVIDTIHSNPWAVWVASGSPTYPAPTEIADELAASQLSSQTIPLVPAGPGSYAATVMLSAPYALARLTFGIQS